MVFARQGCPPTDWTNLVILIAYQLIFSWATRYSPGHFQICFLKKLISHYKHWSKAGIFYLLSPGACLRPILAAREEGWGGRHEWTENSFSGDSWGNGSGLPMVFPHHFCAAVLGCSICPLQELVLQWKAISQPSSWCRNSLFSGKAIQHFSSINNEISHLFLTPCFCEGSQGIIFPDELQLSNLLENIAVSLTANIWWKSSCLKNMAGIGLS